MKKNKLSGIGTAFFLLFLIIFLLTGCESGRRAYFSVEEETITTYPFYDPDPIPVFARSSLWGSGSKIYPYYVFNGFSHTSRPQNWTVVQLKNRYLEVSVLPEVGGKIWGAKDFITGKHFLYTNRVLKFREIGLRGPWTSGGIEFNFGIIGHSPATATPVDYLVEKNPDGSVSCVVGNYDWPSRSRWQVRITLHPDRAYFETCSRWTNPTPYRQSYYSWMCAAVPATTDLKYLFPGKYFIGHDYSVPLESWPVDREGRDLSWYRHNDFGGSKSYFVVGTYDHFYGGYYENSDFGFGHQAHYLDMPGKKIWIWELSRAGEIWVDLLTDADGQYTEPQAGRLLNQSDHSTFHPGVSDSWSEIWFSYSGIGPITSADRMAAISLRPVDEGHELGIYALQPLKEKLVVKELDREIINQEIILRPTEKIKIQLKGVKNPDNLQVYLGQKVIRETAAARDLIRPFKFQRPSGDSVEGLFLAAQTLENERDYSGALDLYLRVIEKEPGHLRALCRLSELYCRRHETRKALDYGRRALEISMYDPEANYVYGLASLQLNLLTEAREAFGWAARSPALAVPAYLRLAEISLLERNLFTAEEFARRAARYDSQNPLPLEILASALRLQGRKEEAARTCGLILSLDPLNHLARYELYLLEPRKKQLENFRRMIRNEFPSETYLELALYYFRTGQLETCLNLLELSPSHPELITWKAFILDKLNRKDASLEALNQAAEASPWLVFPFREESIPVFQWASAQKPDCWKFRYYLGLIFWHKGRLDEAREIFSKLDQADYYPVFIARAYLNSENPEAAYLDLKKARELSPESWRTWHHLLNHELSRGFYHLALSGSLEALERFPDNVYLQSDAVKALLACGRYREAAGLLDRMMVLPYEGASEIHQLFVRAHLHSALELMLEKKWEEALSEISRSREYPETLGTGRPFDPDQRIQDYLEGLCLEKLGRKEEALRKYQEIIDYTRNFPAGPYAGFYQLALKKTGKLNISSPVELNLAPEFRDKLKKLLDF